MVPFLLSQREGSHWLEHGGTQLVNLLSANSPWAQEDRERLSAAKFLVCIIDAIMNWCCCTTFATVGSINEYSGNFIQFNVGRYLGARGFRTNSYFSVETQKETLILSLTLYPIKKQTNIKTGHCLIKNLHIIVISFCPQWQAVGMCRRCETE